MRQIRRRVFLSLLLCLTRASFAETPGVSAPVPGRVPEPVSPAAAPAATSTATPPSETSPTPLPNSLAVTFEVPSLEFSLGPKDGDKTHFKPNEGVNWGLEGTYDGYRAGFAVPMPKDGEEIRTKGRTSHYDAHFGKYFERFGADVYYQTYKGFYLEKGEANDSSDGTVFPQRPDARSQAFGTNVFFSFTPERYPLRSLTQFDDPTDHKGGGFVALLGLHQFDINGSTALVPETGLRKARLQTATLGAGYGYGMSRGGHHMNGFLLLGGGPQAQRLTFNDTTENHVRFGQGLVMNGSYSYRYQAWQGGFLLKLTELESNLGRNEEVSSTGLMFKMFLSRSL